MKYINYISAETALQTLLLGELTALPTVKKSGLDTADTANFRPVSNLTLSKVMERVVARRLFLLNTVYCPAVNQPTDGITLRRRPRCASFRRIVGR